MYDPSNPVQRPLANAPGLGATINNWVNRTAQAMPALQPQQPTQLAATSGMADGTPPGVQTLGAPAAGQVTATAAPVNPMMQPRQDYRQQIQDWRGQRPQMAPGMDRQAFQDWRQARPDRPQWGGMANLANRWPGARGNGGGGTPNVG